MPLNDMLISVLKRRVTSSLNLLSTGESSNSNQQFCYTHSFERGIRMREVMEKVVEVFNTGDTSQVDQLFAQDYIDYQKPSHITVDGPEEFKLIVRGARKYLPNLVVSIEDAFHQNDRIAARLLWTSESEAGEKIRRETIEILRLEDGLIAEHWGAESWRESS
jgi:hypothetical protein